MLTRLRVLVAVVAVVVVGATGTTLATEPTSAAWVDSAYVTAAATAGTWTTPPVAGCVVIDAAGAPVAGPTCRVTFGPDRDGSAGTWQIMATITTTSTTAVRWRLTIDFAASPFPPTKRVGEYSGNGVVAPLAAGFCSGSTRLVTFTGRADWGTNVISATQSAVLDLVGSNTGTAGHLVYSCP